MTNTDSTPAKVATKRMVSLDQFRGYTVLGMFLVNYFGGYKVCPQVLRHTHDYCSYADVIMPQFLFAVGFALRLTFGRRMQQDGNVAAYGRMAKRLLGLVLVSLVVYSVGARAPNWEALTEIGVWGAIKEPLKRQWFQTLMHIAVTSLWILPVIHAKTSVRVAWMVGSAIAHVGLSYWFNFIWANTSPNVIDGGPLGFLTWTIPAILGSIACDWFVPAPTPKNIPSPAEVIPQLAAPNPNIGMLKCIVWGILLMMLGYLFSCGTRWYDVAPATSENVDVATIENVEASSDNAEVTSTINVEEKARVTIPENVETIDGKIAAHPVFPPSSQTDFKKSPYHMSDWLAEAPFVPPPDPSQRKWNYWMMSQRGGTLSYLTFAGGFALVLFSLFYLACDRLGLEIGVFRTFGTNALLAYVLHDLVSNAVQPFFPKDSPAWYAITGLLLFFVINWLFVRSLEKQGVFIRV